MPVSSIEIKQNHINLLQPAIRTAIEYEETMDNKRKIGITGEVGEVKACFKYGLRLVLNSCLENVLNLDGFVSFLPNSLRRVFICTRLPSLSIAS